MPTFRHLAYALLAASATIGAYPGCGTEPARQGRTATGRRRTSPGARSSRHVYRWQVRRCRPARPQVIHFHDDRCAGSCPAAGAAEGWAHRLERKRHDMDHVARRCECRAAQDERVPGPTGHVGCTGTQKLEAGGKCPVKEGDCEKLDSTSATAGELEVRRFTKDKLLVSHTC